MSSALVASIACGAGGTNPQFDPRNWGAERRRMIDSQLRARDIRSARVLDAMLAVPRHVFVPEPYRATPTAIRRCQSDTAKRSLNPTSWRS